MQAGLKQITPFLQNAGGLNTADSPFTVRDEQATGGYNYDYVRMGGIVKSLCAQRLNSSANAQLRTLGLFLRNTKTASKSIIRAAGTKLQLTDLGGTFTNLTEDTAAAGSEFLTSGSEQPVVGGMFVSPTTDILWLAGGGMSSLYGVYSDAKATKNGVVLPTGSITATENTGAGAWAATGVYRYAVAFRKASTDADGNVSLDTSVTVSNVARVVDIDLSSISNLDATKYDTILLYRSAVGGAAEFTTGDLVAEIAAGTTSYTDTGSYLSTSEVVPRTGNTLLDNGPLPSGTFETATVWKRRLVTASDSTIYISDLNKPESWPAANVITIPSGDKITGLAIISFTPDAASTDEFLAIFKESEIWIVSGSSLDDWELKFVDKCGSLNQSSIASANGFLFFVDNRGFYIWDGQGKPFYISRTIEDLFGVNGKLTKRKLDMSCAVFFQRQNQIVWYLSHDEDGEQQYVLKLDVRLTVPRAQSSVSERVLDGIFLPGKVANPVYACASFVFPTSSSQEDVLISGDAAGYLYRQFYSTTGVDTDDYSFSYTTKHLDLGKPGVGKQFYAVHAWIEDVGNWEVVLDYWTDYKSSEDDKNSVSEVINSNAGGTVGLWDVAKWDQAKWDGFISKPRRIVFNLSASPYNNASGDVIRLRFRNEESDEPVTIFGFAVVWAEQALVK